VTSLRTLLVAGLAVLGSGAGIAAAQPASAVRLPNAVVGSFEAFLPLGPGTKPRGRWELAIARNGHVGLVSPYGVALDGGLATISGDRIVFGPERRATGCTGTGTYRFARSGKVLSFTLVRDACTARAFKLTRGEWTRFTDYFPVVIVKR